MYTLAFELSASPCSLALLDNDRVVGSETWPAGRTGDHRFFICMARLFEETGLNPKHIDRFAVGLGPGAYAGLRMALATARVMALPGKKPVYGIASPDLTARALAERQRFTSIAVIGDARRQKLWLARYTITPAGPVLVRHGIVLITPSELPAVVKDTEAIATPHATTVAPMIKAALPSGHLGFIDDAVPTAVMAGRWAPSGGWQDHGDSTNRTLAPVYLHHHP